MTRTRPGLRALKAKLAVRGLARSLTEARADPGESFDKAMASAREGNAKPGRAAYVQRMVDEQLEKALDAYKAGNPSAGVKALAEALAANFDVLLEDKQRHDPQMAEVYRKELRRRGYVEAFRRAGRIAAEEE